MLPYSALGAAAELAAGEALLNGLANVPRPAVRWYGARELALVIGSGQRPSEADDVALVARGATLHKRASGGTAVLFVPGFLMQDVALPAGHRLQISDVSESYRWLGEVWAEALGELGVATQLISISEARADTAGVDPLVRRACFGGRSPYELLADGRKLVGFSQVRRRHGALLQVGLYARWPGPELAELLRMPAEERAAFAAALATRVIGLDELVAAPNPELVVAAVNRAMARRESLTLVPGMWRTDEDELQRSLLQRFAALDPASLLL